MSVLVLLELVDVLLQQLLLNDQVQLVLVLHRVRSKKRIQRRRPGHAHHGHVDGLVRDAPYYVALTSQLVAVVQLHLDITLGSRGDVISEVLEEGVKRIGGREVVGQFQTYLTPSSGSTSAS